MISGQNIICFGSEKWEYPGFQQTVMRQLSKSNKILYINPIGTRKISLKTSQFPFYFKRLVRFFQHNHNSSTNITVCNSWVIPLIYNPLITKWNRHLIRLQFSRLLSKLNFKKYILWVGTPSAAFLIDLFEPWLNVYNPVDRYYAFPFVDSIKIREYEKQIATKSDVIFCTSEGIREDLLLYNKASYTISHGVETKHFNPQAREKELPDDMHGIKPPIIGFMGGLADWVNYDLIYEVAVRYPEANIVLIGRKSNSLNLNKLFELPNVNWLGFKNFNLLPLYLKRFSVCLIPYVINKRLMAVDPIKLKEYLAMGKPVVSVDLPEVRKLDGLVYIGNDNEDFVNKVGMALADDNPSLVEKRIHTAKQNDWSVKIEKVSNIINDILEDKKSLSLQ